MVHLKLNNLEDLFKRGFIRCENCGFKKKVENSEKWTSCPKCGVVFHVKSNKDGRIKRVVTHGMT